MKITPLEAMYTKFVPVAGDAPRDMQRELGLFDVFNLGYLRPGHPHRPPLPFNRQTFHKISLTHGRGRIEYADQVIETGPNTLFLTTPRVPYRWTPLEVSTGFFCIFTDEFLLPTKGGLVIEELPIFQPGAYPVLTLSEAECTAVEAIFQKMVREMTSDYAYKYDLLRTYLVELLHFVQKLLPTAAPVAAPAAARVAARFAELLERQFPLTGAPRPRRLRTAKDYADQLAVHVNHLNRVLKEATGHTTTALIASRVAQEAKLLLKQPGHNVSEVADYLGFADVAHFCTFFKRQTGRTPSDFRA